VWESKGQGATQSSKVYYNIYLRIIFLIFRMVDNIQYYHHFSMIYMGRQAIIGEQLMELLMG
jgi:hypothetical protein